MSNEIYKYNCDTCGYHCNMKSSWAKHINTELHKTGKKKRRSDYKEPLTCDKCTYTTKNKTMMITHKLNKHSTKEDRENEFKYYCKMCDFGSFSSDSMKVHNESYKHKTFLEQSK